VTEESDRNRKGVVRGLTREEVESQLVDLDLPQGDTPVLVDSYLGCNLVQYKDKIYALGPEMGDVDLTAKSQEELAAEQELGHCAVGSSVEEVKGLINGLPRFLQQMNEKMAAKIQRLNEELSGKDAAIRQIETESENLRKFFQRLLSEKDAEIKALHEKMAIQCEKNDDFQREFEAFRFASQQALEERDARFDALKNKRNEDFQRLLSKLKTIQARKWYCIGEVARKSKELTAKLIRAGRKSQKS